MGYDDSLDELDDEDVNLYEALPFGMADFADNEVKDVPESSPMNQGIAATHKLDAVQARTTNPYSTRHDLLDSQAQALHNDAMSRLSTAMKNSPHITTEQGIAAALLAIIPTVGGAILGRSMKGPPVPEGVFGVKGYQPTGMGMGGAMGAKVGQDSALGYLKNLDNTEEENAINLRMAEYENRQANQLSQQANQTELAGLNNKAQDERAKQRAITQLENAKQLASFEHTLKGPDKPTVDETRTSALESLRVSNPKVADAFVNGRLAELTPEERAQVPASLLSAIPGLTRAGTGAERMHMQYYGGHAVLNSPNSPVVPISEDTIKVPIDPKRAQKFMFETIPAVEQAMGNLNLAQQAIKSLGIATSVNGLSPQKAQQVGIALQRVREASLASMAAMSEVSTIKAADSDAKMKLLLDNSLAPIITELNAGSSNARQLLFNNKDLILGQVKEIQQEIARRMGTTTESMGYVFREPIGGVGIDSWKNDKAAKIAALEAQKAAILGGGQ